MLLLSEQNKKYKEIISIIIKKIPFINNHFSQNNTEEENKSVEQFVEIRKVYATHNSVIIEKRKFLGLENDTFDSTKLQNKNQLYNSFLVFCWNNKSSDYLPEAKKVESALKIGKGKRLELQARGINEKVLEKSKNNKVFFSKNFDSIEEVLSKNKYNYLQ